MSLSSSSRLLLSSATRSQTATSARLVPLITRSRHAQQYRPFSISRRTHAKKYTTDHEWIELEPSSKIGKIGISTYAAKALGDVVYVELPQPDAEVAQGDTIGAVESVKSASDIMTPVAGRIVAANSLLEQTPGTINKSPEGEGWIAKIEVERVDAVEGLMDEEAYVSFTGEQEGEKE